MKVCTDACIFGSWIAQKIEAQPTFANCLDIGTGTGLLSLMVAQKNPYVIIDAVEIEENAFEQAKENFYDSEWSDRLHIYQTDIKNFISEKKYDLIICNPPFFENELKSDKKNKNIAKHDEGLSLKELIPVIRKYLSDKGIFAILLPYHRIKYFETLAEENNFFVQEKLLIKQTAKHNFFRGILFLKVSGHFKWPDTCENKTNELIIKDEEVNYTNEFIELMKDYYL